MASAENLPPHSLGLCGDGDEIDAIREVERRFAVKLDYSDACNWVTVGNVYAAFQQAMLASQAEDVDTWPSFAEAICAETGVDPTKVEPSTVLLGTGRFSWRLCIAVAVVAGLITALILHR